MVALLPRWHAQFSSPHAQLVTYLCGGDPTPQATLELMRALAEGGADIIELGMPFSDPTADGPTIQRASERALAAGTKMQQLFEACAAFRRDHTQPVVLFGYLNPIMAYGMEAWVKSARDHGADAALLVDLPPDEDEPFFEAAAVAELGVVPLVAPNSSEARALTAAERSTAFTYYVSMTGVTGARAADLEHAAAQAHALHTRSGKPMGLGFGIKTPADARIVADQVQAVIVGSALVERIEAAEGDVDAACTALRTATQALKAALV